MKRFFTLLLKNTGSILVLAGVAVLAYFQFNAILSNIHLFIAGALFVLGILAEIIVNRYIY